MYAWDELLEHIVYVTNIQGSAMYDSTLGDKSLIDEMYELAREEQSSKRKKLHDDEEGLEANRPPRRGYSREVEAIYDLMDNVVALRGEMGRWPRPTTERAMSKRPWFPGEVVQERMRQYARTRRDSAIKAAQQGWRDRHGAGTG